MRVLKLETTFLGSSCESTYNILYLVTFEDKRKANYERGNVELEKRRQALMEQQQREAERKAQKEKEEWERKQRELQEQEWKKQLELEKRLEKQRELERQREEERRKEIERREVIFKLFCFLRKYLISGFIPFDLKMGIFVVPLSLHHSFLLIMLSNSDPSFPCGGEEGPWLGRVFRAGNG